MAAAYVAYKDPRGAGILVLGFGVLFLVVGLWEVLRSKAPLVWGLIGLGSALVVAGWLMAFVVRWDLDER